jgi:hypothetical protein
MDQPGGCRLPAACLSRDQERDIGLGKQFGLRAQPARSRAGSHEVQLFAELLNFWLVHEVPVERSCEQW